MNTADRQGPCAWVVLPLCIAFASQPHEAKAQTLSEAAFETVNRTLTAEGDAVYLDAAAGDGVAWVEGPDLQDGRISLDVRGADLPGRSFVGVAFHGGDSDFEAVYVRPFNFNASEEERRSHSLQYVSMPDHPWNVLRERSPGVYEAALSPAPAADSWVHLDLELANGHLAVFVNGSTAPTLEVELLGERRSGRIGLWVGNGSDGRFRNLVVTPR